MDVQILPDADSLARAAAARIAAWLRVAEAPRSLALSGGRTPRRMYAELAALDIDWAGVDVFQVDERDAPEGDEERNWTHIAQALTLPNAHPMQPLDADGYGSQLPESLDVVHLGLGTDGHTASLIPGDPALEATGSVAVTNPYKGRRRLTLTFDAINAARQILWVIDGVEKASMLRGLIEGDESIPAARVRRTDVEILADEAAASELSD